MNKQVLRFFELHKDKLVGRVIDIGSLNVNGSVSDVVDISVGVDMRPGPGVDLVCPVENLLKHFAKGEFDACVSSGTLEHIQDWKSFVYVTWDLVKDGGYLVLTMASMDKGRHAYPDDYWRFTEEDIKRIWPNATDYMEIKKPGKPKGCSIGWVVKKEGSLGDLDKVIPIEIV